MNDDVAPVSRPVGRASTVRRFGQVAPQVLGLFGLDGAGADMATLERIAGRVHQVLGYDSTPKMLWAAGDRSGDPPGVDPVDTWEQVLEHGASGTCYAASLAVGALLEHLGFDSTVYAWDLDGRRPGAGIHHCTNVVHLDGRRWLLETSASSTAPVLLPEVDGEAGGDGTCVAFQLGGTMKLVTPRVSVAATKVYRLVAQGLTAAQVVECYRDAVRTQPHIQSAFLWSRTREHSVADPWVRHGEDGAERVAARPVVESLGADGYLVRRDNMVLAEARADAAAAAAVMRARGTSDQWVGTLERLGLLGG